jgi:hypothetical protein
MYHPPFRGSLWTSGGRDKLQKTKQARKTRAAHSRTNSVKGSGSVHYSSTGDSVVIRMDNSLNQK